MTTNDDRSRALELRLKTLLPEEYQETYEDVQPTPMGSAGMKYDADGNVAWNEMWATFCDLAMAGGPPHKGLLLEPAPVAECDAAPEKYDEVVDEICRGIEMVTDLPAQAAPTTGWVRVFCLSEWMAGWLLRAITIENVAVRANARALFLPAGPAYRIDKEIKNVITVIAKTCHYWLGHMSRSQQHAIRDLFASMEHTLPLVVPPEPGMSADSVEASAVNLRRVVAERTGMTVLERRYSGWLGVECASVKSAVSLTRALVASNVLARREGATLFLPVNPLADPDGQLVASRLRDVAIAP